MYSKVAAGILGILAAMSVAVVAARPQSVTAPQYRLGLVDRAGNIQTVGMIPARVFALRVSPDGRQLVWDLQNSIWIYELAGDHSMRELKALGSGTYPMWSADGQKILFTSDRDGEPAIYWQRADGTGAAERLTPFARAPESWSVLNQMFSYITATGSDYDVWTYSFPDKKASPLVALPMSAQHSSSFSPDGHWIAYMSDKTGRMEIYVQAFPSTGEAFQITRDGGNHTLWSPDGRELYYDNGGRLYSVAIQTQPRFSAGTPMPLPISGFVQGTARRQYDITPDGQHFVMMFR